MIKGRSAIAYITGGIFILAIIVLSVKVIIGNIYRKQIPTLPDLQSLSVGLRDQLSTTYNKAYNNPSADNLGMMGLVYHSSTYYDKAAICYKLAIRKNKKKWLWSYYFAYLNRELGESNKAIENFKHVTSENPKMYLAWFYIGEGLQNLGENNQAEAIYARVINVNDINKEAGKNSTNDYFPLGTYARFQLARIYMNTKRLDLASKTLIEIIQANRTFGPAYRLLGSLYSLEGDSVLSKEYILWANDLNNYTTPLDRLIDGISLLSRSDQYILKQIDDSERKVHPEFALVLASRALKYMPDNKYLISKTVKLLLNMHYGKQALPYLDKHIKYFNEDFKEIKYVADLLYNEGLFEQARTYYNRAAELKHEDTDVQSNLVVCLWKEGMKDQALEKMNNLVVNNKENIMILFNGVYVMLAMGEKEASMTYLAKLKYLAPANPKVQLIMGMVAEMDGNLPAAITMYDLSFKGNPKDLATSLALSNALTKQKLWSRAIRQYQQSLEYFPNEPFILEKLGTLLVSCSDSTLRNMDEGMKLSERAFIHKASSPNITIAAGRSIAIAYAARGDYRTAYDYIEWVLDVARNQKVTAEYVKGLENLLMQYNTEKKKNTSGNK